MLVTPKFLTEADVAEWKARAKEMNFEFEYVPPVMYREGIIVGHLNVHSEFKKNNKFDDYPNFRKDEFMLELVHKNLREDPSNKYQLKLLRGYERIPAQDFHVKENWRPVYERQFKWDTPEERGRMIREGRNFENYEPCLGSFGVCDTPEQLLSMYDFDADPRRFFITFTEMRKDEQSDWGGWRWHKWGEYLGTQDPQCEYLYDEPVIESVYVFHIYELLDEDCD